MLPQVVAEHDYKSCSISHCARPEDRPAFSHTINGVRFGFGPTVNGPPPAEAAYVGHGDAVRHACFVKVRSQEPMLAIPCARGAGVVLLITVRRRTLVIGQADFEWYAPVITVNGEGVAHAPVQP